MTRDVWKKNDRECPPCPDCGTELYEAFWGNGGWVRTDRGTGRMHGPDDCVRVLRGLLREARMYCLGTDCSTRALIERIDGVLR